MYFPKRGEVETLALVSEMLARNGKCFSERNRKCAKMGLMTCGGNQVCQTFPQAPGQSLLGGGYWLLLQSQGVLEIYQEIRFLDLEEVAY